MPEYEDWESLVSAAQDACGKVLVNHVKPVMEDIVKRHIQTDIYDAYTPVEIYQFGGKIYQGYQRRHILEKSMYYELQGRNKDTIMVTSSAPANKPIVKGYSFHNRRPGAFLKMLEGPKRGIWRNGFPRPAISNAQSEIDRSKAIDRAIQAGINQYF